MIRRLAKGINVKREKIRSTLEDIIEDMDASDWSRVETSKARVKVTGAFADDLEEVRRVMVSSGNAVSTNGRPSKSDEEAIDRLCAKYGVNVEMPADMGDPRSFTQVPANAGSVDLAVTEEGIVGTPVFSGRPQKEPTGKYNAFTVRGSGGNAGLYEEYWASESQIYDAVQGHIDSLASGAWEIQMPEYVEPQDRDAMREFVKYHNARMRQIQCMEGGFGTFIEHAATFIPIGFSLFEPVFKKDRQSRWYLKKMGFREQASVDEWFLNDKGDKIRGVKFKTTGDNSDTYTLAATDDFRTNHLVWFGIGAFGSNFEGRPPTRPALHWVKMKRLIAQIVPLSIEKYGVPIAYIKADVEYLKALAQGAGLVQPNLSDAYDKFKDARAVEGPVFKFADGVTAEIIGPPNTMPDLHTWIQYCDQMISYTYSNEGNLLGMNSAVGSYAQAEVKERRFMRSAPGYARKITESMNEKVWGPLARRSIREDLIETPKMVYRPDAMMDAGQWLANARTLFGPNLPLEEWPKRYQDIAHEKMGVQPESKDEDQA